MFLEYSSKQSRLEFSSSLEKIKFKRTITCCFSFLLFTVNLIVCHIWILCLPEKCWIIQHSPAKTKQKFGEKHSFIFYFLFLLFFYLLFSIERPWIWLSKRQKLEFFRRQNLFFFFSFIKIKIPIISLSLSLFSHFSLFFAFFSFQSWCWEPSESLRPSLIPLLPCFLTKDQRNLI